MNDFSKKGDRALEALAASASAVIGANKGVYNLPADLGAGLTTASQNFGSLLDVAKTKQDAARQSTANKDAGRAALLGTLAQVSAVLYGPTSTVTDGELQAIGFAPRRSGRSRPRLAQRVTGVAAAPDAEGSSARVSWDRGLNSKTTIFQVECSTGGPWTICGSTSRVALTASVTPGVKTSFRVVSTTAVSASEPSSVVSVYDDPLAADAVELKVA